MRQTVALLALLPFGIIHGQDYKQILLADPYLSNGYFIVDEAKFQQLQLTHIDVDIMAHRLLVTGGTTEELIDSITITDSFFGKADLGFLGSLQAGEFGYYTLRGYNTVGAVPVAFGPVGGDGPWTEICRETCNAPSYAWSVRKTAQNGSMKLELAEGIDAETQSFYYFYVADADWIQFTDQHSPNEFGLDHIWMYYDSNPSTEVIQLTADEGGAPAEAYNIEGYTIPVHTPVHGIRKGMGDWDDIMNNSAVEMIDDGTSCGGYQLMDLFNSYYDLVDHQGDPLPELTCSGLSTAGEGVSWGPGSTGICTSFTLTTFTGPDGTDLIDWVVETVECPEFELDPGEQNDLSSVSGVTVHRWDIAGKTKMLGFAIPEEGDPRLVPIPKTRLDTGLYEFMIVLRDGHIIRHFEDFSQPVILNAKFSSFVDVNVYPVPVTGRNFAVNFDLQVPMDINMSVVNNQGVSYYSHLLHYTIPGRNKHVVTMPTPWPSGIYHCIFQYPDGSSDSKNITVN